MTDLTCDEDVTLVRPLSISIRPPMLEAVHQVAQMVEGYAKKPVVAELVTELMAPLAAALILLSSVLGCVLLCVLF
jgi:hypothetical protein